PRLSSCVRPPPVATLSPYTTLFRSSPLLLPPAIWTYLGCPAARRTFTAHTVSPVIHGMVMPHGTLSPAMVRHCRYPPGTTPRCAARIVSPASPRPVRYSSAGSPRTDHSVSSAPSTTCRAATCHSGEGGSIGGVGWLAARPGAERGASPSARSAA